MPNGPFGEILKGEAYNQTVLPDRSISIEQKLVANAKIEKFKSEIFGDFQTLCHSLLIATELLPFKNFLIMLM